MYGGGSLGLMGGVSMAAFLGGSQVLRVVPFHLDIINLARHNERKKHK